MAITSKCGLKGGGNRDKLKTVEKYLGIERKDTINGLESIKLYKEYERTGDDTLKKKVLLHNFEDILHLLPTMNILNYIKKDRIFAFLPKEFSYNDKLTIRTSDYKISKDFLYVTGSYCGDLNQDFVYYNHTYDLSLLRDNQQFSLKIPLLSVNDTNDTTYTFINLNELDFLDITLSALDNKEKLKYLVKAGNEVKDFNIFSFTKEFSLNVLDRITLDKDS